MKPIAKARIRQLPLVLVGGLVVLWLVLSQSVGVGTIALGVVLSVMVAWASLTLRPLRPRLRRPFAAFGLLLTVTLDVVRSNLAVAWIVLRALRGGEVKGGFVEIPLDIRDPHGLAGLAAIITFTPGTVWSGVSADGKTLTLHVLDLDGSATLAQWIKARYEQPLMRIFE